LLATAETAPSVGTKLGFSEEREPFTFSANLRYSAYGFSHLSLLTFSGCYSSP
jgi:hypothetical protein